MADYYDLFSFQIEKISDEEKAWLEQYGEKAKEDDEDCFCAFGQYDEGSWWFHDGNSNSGEIIPMIREFLEKFRPTKYVAFEVAETCSKPRLDAFGGYAVFITAESSRSFSTSEWLYNVKKGEL